MGKKVSKKSNEIDFSEDLAKFMVKPNSKGSKDKKPSGKGSINFQAKREPSHAPNNAQRYKGFNDPRWYAANEQLLRDAASLAFANFQGITIHDTGLGISPSDFHPASVMALNYIPTFGQTDSAVDAMNIATRAVYSYVRHANSGHTNYESADMGMYIHAVIELYGQIAYLERIYGISRNYSVKNRSIPLQLLTACDCDEDDILANQANLRYGINRLIQKLGSLVIPKGFSLLERRIWMNSFVFKDADTDKASLYIFVPAGFYRYNAKLNNHGGGLNMYNYPAKVQNASWKVKDLIDFVEDNIDAVLEDEDMNIMSGDILKAYGDGGLAHLGYLPEDYLVVPVYQPEVLPQIHNSIFCAPTMYMVASPIDSTATYVDTPVTISGDATNGFTGANIMLEQNDGVMKFNLCFGVGTDPSTIAFTIPQPGTLADYVPTVEAPSASSKYSPFPLGKVLLDLPTDSATPADVMVATRLHPSFQALAAPDVNNTTHDYTVVRSMGSEVLLNALVFRAQVNNPTSAWGSVVPYTSSIFASVFMPSRMEQFCQFDMHPLIYLNDDNTQGTASFDYKKFTWKSLFGDIYNFTAIEPEVLKKLHDTAILSEVSLANSLFANN